MVRVRSPASLESSLVAELVLQSDCGMLPALFGPGVKALVARLQSSRRNPYAGENTLVIVAEAGSVAGALVGSRIDAARASNLPTAALLFRWYGPAVMARIPLLARAGGALQHLAPDDYYLSHIAVLPGSRGKGLGRVLLAEGERRAALLGCGRLVLDVEENNENARAFYHREGYRRIENVLIDLGKHGRFAFLRLAKWLRAPVSPPVRG